jgi:transporter family protein
MSSQFWLILIAIVGWGVGSYLAKISNAEMQPLIVSAVSMVVYMIVLPIAIAAVKPDLTITPFGVIVTVIGSLFMCVGSLGFAYALRNGGAAGQTTILTALYPALTLALSMTFMKETIGLKQGIGIGLALVSFILLNLK